MSVFQHERTGDVDELLALLETSEKPVVRARAAEALGEMDRTSEAVVEGLIDRVESDDVERVRAVAIDALDDIGDEALERLLGRIAGRENESEGRDGTPGVDIRTAIEYLDAGMPELRMVAATILGRRGGGGVVSRLAGAIDDPDPRVRARVARACGRIGDPRAASALADAADDPRSPVRREVARALGEVRGEGALSALLDLCADRSEGVRREAVGALGEFDHEDPVEPLVEALGDPAETVRRAAVYAIIQLLSNAPVDRSHEMRESVISAINAIDDPAVLDPLVDLLTESKQTGHRRNTAWLLGRITGEDPPESVVDALIEALGDEDDMVAQFAATSLASIGGDAAEEALIDALDAVESSETRAKVVFTLGKVGGESARERIDELLDVTDDEDVRQQAFSALSKLGGASE